MIWEIRRESNHSWLVIKGKEASMGYAERMITENTIPGLLPCSSMRMDDGLQLCYEITDLVPLDDWMNGRKLRAGELLTLLENLCLSLEGMEEYLLEAAHLLLEPEFIYTDREIKRIYFCYVPEKEQSMQDAFRVLTEYLLPRLDHRDNQAVTLGYGIYRYSMEEEFGTDSLRRTAKELVEKSQENCQRAKMSLEQEELWEREELQAEKARREEALQAFFGEEDEMNPPDEKRKVIIFTVMGIYFMFGFWLGIRHSLWIGLWVLTGLTAFLAGVIFLLLRNRRKKREAEKEPDIFENPQKTDKDVFAESQTCAGEKKQEQENFRRQSFPGTISYSLWTDQGKEETCLLTGSMKGQERYCLREISPDSGGIFFFPERGTFLIGKMQEAADLILPAPTISRIHARVRKTEGRWYLKDMNSKNGTYRNGQRIPGDQETEIQEGDELQFAEKRYVFSREWTDTQQ